MALKLARNSRGFAVCFAIAISASLLWYGTGLHPRCWLTWLASVPVLFLAARVSPGVAFLSATFAWALGGLNEWLYLRHYVEMPLSTSLLAVVSPALLFACAALLWRFFVRRGQLLHAALAFSSFWVVLEFALQRQSPHSTWGSVAYSQIDFLPVLQVASLTGLLGITFLLFLTSGAVAALLSASHASWRQSLTLGTSVGALLLAVILWGNWRIRSYPANHSSLIVGLVSSDLPQNLSPQSTPAKTRLFAEYAAAISQLAGRGAQVVLLPEKIAKVDDRGAAELDAAFSHAGLGKTMIIVGLEHWTSDAKLNESRIYAADGQLVATFEKHHMLPAYESDLLPGTTLTLFNTPAGKCGVTICKDMDFPALSRQYGERNVGVQFVSAWDFVTDGFLHARMAVMRAVESGFSLVRSAKQGRLTVADNRGRILAERSTGGVGFATLLATVPVAHANTPYVKCGDLFPWLNLILLVLLLVFHGRGNTIHMSGVGTLSSRENEDGTEVHIGSGAPLGR